MGAKAKVKHTDTWSLVICSDVNVFFALTIFLMSFFFKKIWPQKIPYFLENLVVSEIWIVLCYLMACHYHPMVFNLRIPCFIEAKLRVWQWVMHYAPKQFSHI